ncbi:BCAM0308 family protein [Hydrogenobaculum acidophilum]
MNNRKDRMIEEYIHDPYFSKEKYEEPSVCEICGVVFHDGVFKWEDAPKNAKKMVCPACRRIQDKYYGGIVELSGAFLKAHKEEILNLIRNEEEKEKNLRPLERIATIEENDNGITIKTTYEHMARRLGEAVHKAYKGSLELKYQEDSHFLRVKWHRD